MQRLSQASTEADDMILDIINISRKLRGKEKQCYFSTSSVKLACLIHSHSPALLEQVRAVSDKTLPVSGRLLMEGVQSISIKNYF
jgi:hypothetical protein